MDQKTRRRKPQRTIRRKPQKTRKNQRLIKGGFSISRFWTGIIAYISAVKNATEQKKPGPNNALALLPKHHDVANYKAYDLAHPVKDVAKGVRIQTDGIAHDNNSSHGNNSRFHSAKSHPSVDGIATGLTDDESRFYSAKEEHIAEEISKSLEIKSMAKKSLLDDLIDKANFVKKTLPILGELTIILMNDTLSLETQKIVDSIDSKYDDRIIWKKVDKKYVPTIDPHGAPKFISGVVKTLQEKNHFKLSKKDNSIIYSIIRVITMVDKRLGIIPNSVLIKFFEETIKKMEKLKTLKKQENREGFNKVFTEDVILRAFLNIQGLTYKKFDEGKLNFFAGILTTCKILVSMHNRSEQNSAETILTKRFGKLSEKEYTELMKTLQEKTSREEYTEQFFSAL
jgi:hypothetical protein